MWSSSDGIEPLVDVYDCTSPDDTAEHETCVIAATVRARDFDASAVLLVGGTSDRASSLQLRVRAALLQNKAVTVVRPRFEGSVALLDALWPENIGHMLFDDIGAALALAAAFYTSAEAPQGTIVRTRTCAALYWRTDKWLSGNLQG
jgi:hypothetical protein